MKTTKDQFVIACLEKAADAAIVLSYARHCARRLGKGLVVLSVAKEGTGDWIKQYGLPYIGLKGDWKTAVDGLPTVLGGVLAVTAVERSAPRSSIANPSTLLKTFADCKIAYLVVGDHCSAPNDQWPETTVLSLDHRRESKEKLIWGSYMVRFFGSRLTLATPDYKDALFREKLHNNILFTQKMYRSLGVDYSLKAIAVSGFTPPDLAIVDNCPPPYASHRMLISMTTDRRDRDLGDLLGGTTERKLLQRSSMPILFLNQRDDLYVLCD